jgi:hypothetical protein
MGLTKFPNSPKEKSEIVEPEQIAVARKLFHQHDPATMNTLAIILLLEVFCMQSISMPNVIL